MFNLLGQATLDMVVQNQERVLKSINTLWWSIGALAGLIVIQILYKTILYYKVDKVLTSTSRLANVAEAHGNLTDVQRERIAEIGKEIRADSKAAAVQAAKAAVQAALTTKHAISQIPERTAEKVVEKIKSEGTGGPGGSGINLGGGGS